MFCIESAAASIAAWRDRNYEMMFSRTWGFDILPEDPAFPGVIGKRITAGFIEDDILKPLEIYHGLRVGFNKAEGIDFLYNEILRELKEGMPVGIYFDESYLPWKGKKGDIPGFLLIVGYEGQQVLYCLDIHNGYADIKSLPVECLLNLGNDSTDFLFYYTFSLVNDERRNIDYYDFLLNFRKCKSLNKNPFESMRYLAAYIAENMDYTREKCNANDIYYVPLLLNIMQLIRARKLMASSADYIWKITKNPLLHNLNKDFLEIGYEWHQVWNKLFKLFYIHEDNTEEKIKIAKKITKIAEKEERLINEIVNNEYNHIQYEFVRREEQTESRTNSQIQCLDIKGHMNNKAFARNELNEEKADLTGQGEYFLCNGLPNDGIFDVAGMKFTIHVNGIHYDNISCFNQIIHIPRGNYKRLLFLGCSEWGEGFGQLKIIYHHGFVEKTFLYLPNWDNNNPNGAVNIWKGKIIGLNHCTEERSLFAVSFEIKSNEEIKEIQLPDVTNMHIFAISLELFDR